MMISRFVDSIGDKNRALDNYKNSRS